MSLSSKQINILLEIAKDAAKSASKIISNSMNKNIQTKLKDGGENYASQVVTEIDHKAQEAIFEIITPSLKDFNLGLLSEESPDDNSRFERDFFWCIDPLDGTLAFSKGEDGYSCSIALVSQNGEPIIGVVANPQDDSLYTAIKGEGALKNDSKFLISSQSDNLTLLYDQSYLNHPNFDEHIKKIEKEISLHNLKDVFQLKLGGAVMNAISTIERAPAIYYKLPKEAKGGGSLWDYAASSLIQREAGGYNSNYFGKPLDLNREDCTFMNHEGAIYTSYESLKSLVP